MQILQISNSRRQWNIYEAAATGESVSFSQFADQVKYDICILNFRETLNIIHFYNILSRYFHRCKSNKNKKWQVYRNVFNQLNHNYAINYCKYYSNAEQKVMSLFKLNQIWNLQKKIISHPMYDTSPKIQAKHNKSI